MGKIRKILMLLENSPAPTDNRVWAEAVALRDYGFQVSIIGPKGAKEYRELYTCIDTGHENYLYEGVDGKICRTHF